MSRLIDADALKETIVSNVYPVADDFNSRDYGMFWTGGIEKAIDEQPTVEERKKGKWIVFDIDEEKYDEIKCTFCKHTFIVDSHHWTDIGFTKDDLNYCPHCGADMRGEEHEHND